MIIKTVVVGPLQVNCHIIGDEKTGKAMIIDPGDEPDMILDAVGKLKLIVEYIICTHGHFDHVGAVGDIKKGTGAKIVINESDMNIYDSAAEMAHYFGLEFEPQPAPDEFVHEGDNISVGSLTFAVLQTPGHSPGGLSLYGEGIAITGDTLFAGSIGRTDLPGGNEKVIGKSLRMLLSLPEDTKVFCGHGPASTIGREKRENPFATMFQ
ncbi:MAG TPA: MBL fold metallo-hydrolase [Dissulfurispiraceae bacterium]|nr:MBL fold metallo-hydrolase [Dissulfurispiraceae bacterium]